MPTVPASPGRAKVNRKPRPKPIRRARLAVQDGKRVLVLTICSPRVDGHFVVEQFRYALSDLPSDFGRGYRLGREASTVKAGEADHYDVNLAPDGNHSCECPGHSRFGLDCGDKDGPFPGCKHISALLSLTAQGRLPLATA